VRLFSPGVRRIVFFFLAFALSALTFWVVRRDKLKPPPASRTTPGRAAHNSGSHFAKLAIILDDVAGDPSAANAIFTLSYPLTLSILPNHPDSTSIADEAHRRGYEVMLHLPMESQANETPEVQQLHPGMSTSQISRLLDEMLLSVPHAVGVNNHQGSLVTSDAKIMKQLMPMLRERKLFFVDSRTTAATVAFETAQHDGVRSAFRNVPFLDDVQEESSIRRQLELAIRGAKEKGEAIVIGHPHLETLRVLKVVLPELQSQDVELVPASSLAY
jgi:polysaccharide deacetylase 2 family uncharacterized protein YibQ